MQNIWDVYLFLLSITDPTRGGYVNAVQASQSLEAGQMAVFNRFWQSSFGSNQTGLEALTPFVLTNTIQASATGLVVPPTGMVHILSILRTDGSAKAYRIMLAVETEYALNSVLYPIASNPRYQQSVSGIQLFPKKPAAVELRYLKEPDAPVIGYTLDGSGNEVYNPLTSTQLGFDRIYWIEIILEALRYLGVSTSNAEVESLAAAWQTQVQS